MNRIAIALMCLTFVSVSRAESRDELERPFVTDPTAAGWTVNRLGLDGTTSRRAAVPGFVSALPGRVAAHAIRRSKAGEIMAEVVLLDDLPSPTPLLREWSSDRAIEPGSRDRFWNFDMYWALPRVATCLGALAASPARGAWGGVHSWACPVIEAFVFTDSPIPRWRIGTQFVHLDGGRRAAFIYRVAGCLPHAELWEQVRGILKSIRFVKPA